MSILDAVLLGVVQGITEFLPISSSGHLILARDVLGIAAEGGLAFDASLHLATLLAIVVYFYTDIKNLAETAYAWLRRRQTNAASLRLVKAILIGSIPAVVAGVLFGGLIEMIFRSPFSVAGGLIIGSIIMLFAELDKEKPSETGTISTKNAFIIGIFQAFALIPGMSRSGMTMSGGMLLGLSREQAARFAFLLAVPIVLGAGGTKFLELLTEGAGGINILPLLLGCLAAFGSGLGAVWGLMKLLRKHSLIPFVGYRIIVAIIVLFLAF